MVGRFHARYPNGVIVIQSVAEFRTNQAGNHRERRDGPANL